MTVVYKKDRTKNRKHKHSTSTYRPDIRVLTLHLRYNHSPNVRDSVTDQTFFIKLQVVVKKVTFSLCVIQNYATKPYRGMKLQLHLFSVSALDVVFCQLHIADASSPRRKTLVPTEQAAGWAQEPVWTQKKIYL